MGQTEQGKWVKWRDHRGKVIGLLRLTFEEHGGRMECVGLEVRSIGTLTASMLRQIRLAEEADKQRRVLAIVRPAQAVLSRAQAEEVKRLQRAWTGRRGACRYGPEHFAEVARIYRDAYAVGRTPTRAVARHFKTTQAAAAKWIGRCRSDELKLLPKTKRGKALSVKPRRKP
jgi:CRP-like cAMP-binding protein